MSRVIRGNHHLTFCVGTAQDDYDFHTKTLGLRSIKKTALYDGEVPIYHLYYGNAHGDGGTILTAFPMRQQGVAGRLGTNQISRMNLSVPAPVLVLSLMARYQSRQPDGFGNKVIAALRNEFGGHPVKSEEQAATAAPKP